MENYKKMFEGAQKFLLGDLGKFFLSEGFEKTLDGLLNFKKVEYEARRSQKNQTLNKKRIQKKLRQVLKAYRAEIATGATWAFLPAKFSRWLILAVVAMDIFEAEKPAPKKSKVRA